MHMVIDQRGKVDAINRVPCLALLFWCIVYASCEWRRERGEAASESSSAVLSFVFFFGFGFGFVLFFFF